MFRKISSITSNHGVTDLSFAKSGENNAVKMASSTKLKYKKHKAKHAHPTFEPVAGHVIAQLFTKQCHITKQDTTQTLNTPYDKTQQNDTIHETSAKSPQSWHSESNVSNEKSIHNVGVVHEIYDTTNKIEFEKTNCHTVNEKCYVNEGNCADGLRSSTQSSTQSNNTNSNNTPPCCSLSCPVKHEIDTCQINAYQSQQQHALCASTTLEGQHITHTPPHTPTTTIDIWQSLLHHMRTIYGEVVYHNWFNNLVLRERTRTIQNEVSDTIFVTAPTKFVRELIIKNYLEAMLRYLHSIKSHIIKIDIQVNHLDNNKSVFSISANGDKVSLTKENIPISITNNYNAKSKNTTYRVSSSEQQHVALTECSVLNQKFTFEKFVHGPSNSVAYNAAKQFGESVLYENDESPELQQKNTDTKKLLQNPSTKTSLCSFRGLYIHGNVGMGKTHLLQSIANYITNHSIKLNVVYLTAEQFTQQYILSVKKNCLAEFKSALNNVDILIIDDLQLICGRSGTEREFVNVFDTLLVSSHKKRVILAADRAPYSLNFAHRTKSRLTGCMVTGIEDADYSLRVKILQNKAQEMALQLQDALLHLIAEKVSTSIRELEAILHKIATHCSILGMQINHSIVHKLLDEYDRDTNIIVNNVKNKDFITANYTKHTGFTHTKQSMHTNVHSTQKIQHKKNIPNIYNKVDYSQYPNNTITGVMLDGVQTIMQQDKQQYEAPEDLIIHKICEEFNVTTESVVSYRRTPKLLLIRQIMAFLLRDLTDLNLQKIGQKLGGRDHSTVIQMTKALFKTLDKDQTGDAYNKFDKIKKQCTAALRKSS